MLMRVRLPELLRDTGMTPYAVAKASEGRVSLSALYRLKRANGHVRYLDTELVEGLAYAFGIKDVRKLIELEGP